MNDQNIPIMMDESNQVIRQSSIGFNNAQFTENHYNINNNRFFDSNSSNNIKLNLIQAFYDRKVTYTDIDLQRFQNLAISKYNIFSNEFIGWKYRGLIVGQGYPSFYLRNIGLKFGFLELDQQNNYALIAFYEDDDNIILQYATDRQWYINTTASNMSKFNRFLYNQKSDKFNVAIDQMMQVVNQIQKRTDAQTMKMYTFHQFGSFLKGINFSVNFCLRDLKLISNSIIDWYDHLSQMPQNETFQISQKWMIGSLVLQQRLYWIFQLGIFSRKPTQLICTELNKSYKNNDQIHGPMPQITQNMYELLKLSRQQLNILINNNVQMLDIQTTATKFAMQQNQLQWAASVFKKIYDAIRIVDQILFRHQSMDISQKQVNITTSFVILINAFRKIDTIAFRLASLDDIVFNSQPIFQQFQKQTEYGTKIFAIIACKLAMIICYSSMIVTAKNLQFRTGITRSQRQTNTCLGQMPKIIQFHAGVMIKSMRSFAKGHVNASTNPTSITKDLCISTVCQKAVIEKKKLLDRRMHQKQPVQIQKITNKLSFIDWLDTFIRRKQLMLRNGQMNQVQLAKDTLIDVARFGGKIMGLFDQHKRIFKKQHSQKVLEFQNMHEHLRSSTKNFYTIFNIFMNNADSQNVENIMFQGKKMTKQMVKLLKSGFDKTLTAQQFKGVVQAFQSKFQQSQMMMFQKLQNLQKISKTTNNQLIFSLKTLLDSKDHNSESFVHLLQAIKQTFQIRIPQMLQKKSINLDAVTENLGTICVKVQQSQTNIQNLMNSRFKSIQMFHDQMDNFMEQITTDIKNIDMSLTKIQKNMVKSYQISNAQQQLSRQIKKASLILQKKILSEMKKGNLRQSAQIYNIKNQITKFIAQSQNLSNQAKQFYVKYEADRAVLGGIDRGVKQNMNYMLSNFQNINQQIKESFNSLQNTMKNSQQQIITNITTQMVNKNAKTMLILQQMMRKYSQSQQMTAQQLQIFSKNFNNSGEQLQRAIQQFGQKIIENMQLLTRQASKQQAQIIVNKIAGQNIQYYQKLASLTNLTQQQNNFLGKMYPLIKQIANRDNQMINGIDTLLRKLQYLQNKTQVQEQFRQFCAQNIQQLTKNSHRFGDALDSINNTYNNLMQIFLQNNYQSQNQRNAIFQSTLQTRADLQRMQSQVYEKFDNLYATTNQRFDGVDNRLNDMGNNMRNNFDASFQNQQIIGNQIVQGFNQNEINQQNIYHQGEKVLSKMTDYDKQLKQQSQFFKSVKQLAIQTRQSKQSIFNSLKHIDGLNIKNLNQLMVQFINISNQKQRMQYQKKRLQEQLKEHKNQTSKEKEQYKNKQELLSKSQSTLQKTNQQLSSMKHTINQQLNLIRNALSNRNINSLTQAINLLIQNRNNLEIDLQNQRQKLKKLRQNKQQLQNKHEKINKQKKTNQQQLRQIQLQKVKLEERAKLQSQTKNQLMQRLKSQKANVEYYQNLYQTTSKSQITLRAKVDEYQSKIRQLKKLQEFQDKFHQREKQKAKFEQSIKFKQKQLQELKLKLKQKQYQRNSFESRMKQMENEVMMNKVTVSQLQKQKKQYQLSQQRYQHEKSTSSRLNQEIIDLNRKITSASILQNQLKQKKSRLDSQVSSLQNQIKSLKDNVQTLQKKLRNEGQQYLRKMQKLKMELAQSQNKVKNQERINFEQLQKQKNLQMRISQKQDELKNLQKKLKQTQQQKKREITKLTQQLQQQKQNLKTKQKQNEKIKTASIQQKQMYQKQQQMNKNLIEDKKKQISQLRNKNLSSLLINEQNKEALQRSAIQYKAMLAQKQKLQNKSKQLAQKLQNLKKQSEQMEYQKNNQIQNSKSKIKQMQRKIQNQQKSMKQLQQINNSVNQQLQQNKNDQRQFLQKVRRIFQQVQVGGQNINRSKKKIIQLAEQNKLKLAQATEQLKNYYFKNSQLTRGQEQFQQFLLQVLTQQTNEEFQTKYLNSMLIDQQKKRLIFSKLKQYKKTAEKYVKSNEIERKTRNSLQKIKNKILNKKVILQNIENNQISILMSIENIQNQIQTRYEQFEIMQRNVEQMRKQIDTLKDELAIKSKKIIQLQALQIEYQDAITTIQQLNIQKQRNKTQLETLQRQKKRVSQMYQAVKQYSGEIDLQGFFSQFGQSFGQAIYNLKEKIKNQKQKLNKKLQNEQILEVEIQINTMQHVLSFLLASAREQLKMNQMQKEQQSTYIQQNSKDKLNKSKSVANQLNNSRSFRFANQVSYVGKRTQSQADLSLIDQISGFGYANMIGTAVGANNEASVGQADQRISLLEQKLENSKQIAQCHMETYQKFQGQMRSALKVFLNSCVSSLNDIENANLKQQDSLKIRKICYNCISVFKQMVQFLMNIFQMFQRNFSACSARRFTTKMETMNGMVKNLF